MNRSYVSQLTCETPAPHLTRSEAYRTWLNGRERQSTVALSHIYTQYRFGCRRRHFRVVSAPIVDATLTTRLIAHKSLVFMHMVSHPMIEQIDSTQSITLHEI